MILRAETCKDWLGESLCAAPGVADLVMKEVGSCAPHARSRYGLSLPVGSWGGTWSLESHLITVATLKDDPWCRPGILKGSRHGPGACFSQQVISRRKKQECIGVSWAMVALGRRIHVGHWRACILSVTYTVHRVDFTEVRWPRQSSVLGVGSGGGEEVCMPCLCTQVSHQTWGLGLKEQGVMTKNLVCEVQQRAVDVEIHAKPVGRQKLPH